MSEEGKASDWRDRTGHRRRHQRQPSRERAQREGQFVQVDGSDHDWLEGRGPRLTSIALVDYATGKILGGSFAMRKMCGAAYPAKFAAAPPGARL